MKRLWEKLKQKVNYGAAEYDIPEEVDEGYVSIDTDYKQETTKELLVKPYVVNSFDDIKQILDALRIGTTIALVNIGPLKQKDMEELRRAIAKLKKTVNAIEGDIAGFGEDWIALTPKAARIYRNAPKADKGAGTADVKQI